MKDMLRLMVKVLLERGQEAFNETEYFEKEILPLIEDLYAKCGEKGIPLMLLACQKLDKEGLGVRRVINFPGARTPLLFRLTLTAEQHTRSADDPLFLELLSASIRDVENNKK